MSTIEFITGDSREALKALPAGSVHCCITSPPYFGLRDYGVEGQIGLEPSLEGYVNELMLVFAEVKRVLREDGTFWLNLGDSFFGGAGSPTLRRKDAAGVERPSVSKTCERCGEVFEGTPKRRFCSAFCGGVDNAPCRDRLPYYLKPKDLIGMPWRVAFALQADGWYLRSDIIWAKPNAMPESVTDRPTRAHEYLFMFAKSARYFYDCTAVSEPATMKPQQRFTDGRGTKAAGRPLHRRPAGMTDPQSRNRRSVWNINTRPFPGAHFAVFPPALVEPCLLAGCPEGGTILDPFAGAGTVGLVAQQHNRNAILVELNPEYVALAKRRLEEARCTALF